VTVDGSEAIADAYWRTCILNIVQYGRKRSICVLTRSTPAISYCDRPAKLSSRSFNFMRPWRMRVLTVPTGQFTVSAISAQE
jgi:hypothetical protein